MGFFDDPSHGLCGGGGGSKPAAASPIPSSPTGGASSFCGGGMPGVGGLTSGCGGMGGGDGSSSSGGGGMPGGCGGMGGGSGCGGMGNDNGTIGGNPNSTQGTHNGPLETMGNFCGTQNTTATVKPDWYDPMGPSGWDPKTGRPIWSATGGPQQRQGIFDAMTGLQPEIAQNAANTANAMKLASIAPGFGQARDYASRVMNGDYLNGSPQLDNAMGAMRAASGAESANTAARLKSQYAQNGMSFGTPQMAALENNQATNTASANNSEAQARLASYQSERQAQQQAPSIYEGATTTPLNYLAGANNAYLSPLSSMGQLVAGLSGNGQIQLPDTVVQPGATTQMLGAIGQL